jgi:FkbM family methyltransferase
MNDVIKYWDDNLVSIHIGTEINWIHSYIKENNIDKISFIDIGGNVGKFFDELSKNYTIDKCIIVEPSKRLYEYMYDKFKNNTQVIVHNFGISNQNGLFQFNDNEIDYWLEREIDDSINLGTFKMQSIPGETQFYTMDYFMENYNTIDPKKITFIKIDTENRDLYVLKYLKNYLKKNKINPLILFENNFHADMSLEEAQTIVNNFCDVCGYESTNLGEGGDKCLKPINNFKTTSKEMFKTKLTNKICEIVHNFKIDKRFWNHDTLSGEEHDTKRSKPAPYLKVAIEIAKTLNMKTVVEIGASRYAVTQKCLDYFDDIKDVFISPPCCNDGHSTYFLASAGFEVYSVDIDENVKTAIDWSFQNLKKEIPSNLHLSIPKDGIEFLKEFNNKIDFLFLDGWDKGTHEYSEKHLEAFLSAKDKLSDIHLILIDDTDFITSLGGKDALLTPFLIDLGYIPLINGRQTLFINTLNIDGFIEESKLDYNEPKVVVTLSTVPSRLSDTKYGDMGIKSCLKSLNEQSYSNYEIHFNIPYFSSYSGEKYEIPDWIKYYDKIKIFRVDDIGPATKVVPTIQRIDDPETIIIVVDDDLVYHKDMIKEHSKNQSQRDYVFGYDSLGTPSPVFNDKRDHFVISVPFEVEGKILQHYKTVSYKRRYFEDDFFAKFVGKTKSDDILLSAYMKKQGITKMVMPYENEEKLNTLEQWEKKGGVETFPVIRHCYHDSGDGCRDERAVKIEIPFFIPQEFTDKNYI